MIFLSGIKEISHLYDYFIFDVWGVVHDGLNPYPNVVEAIKFLRGENKKICFLSNAPRRAVKVADVLAKFGITSDLYDFVLTSGEATFFDLQKNQNEGFKKFGKNYFYIGPEKDLALLDGLDYLRVESAANASFIINTGFDNDHSVIEEKLPQIVESKKFNLPMICVNPDMIVVRQNGVESICAGTLAREYEKIDGKVFYYGKPFIHVYEIVYEIFAVLKNSEASFKKMIAIGDGIETDIKGANDFGIDSLLVTGGILCNPLKIKFWEDAKEKDLKAICEIFKTFPKFVISNLKL